MARNSLPSELDLVQQPSYGLPDWAQRPQAQTVNTGGAVPFQAEFLSASQKYGVPFNVLMGLAEQESSFNPTAIGVPTKYGRAKGLMQYIDSTASRMGINPYDPVQSIDAAARQLRERLDKGYSMQEAVQAHFGGDDRAQWGPKTAQYGKDVLGRAEKFLGGGQSVAAGQPTQQQEQPQTRMEQIAQDYPPAQSAMENLDQTRQRTQALLDEMNKEEPGRYRPLTDEEMQRLSQHITPEMQQQAMQSGKPIEINIPDLVQPGQAVTAQQSQQQPEKRQAELKPWEPTLWERIKGLIPGNKDAATVEMIARDIANREGVSVEEVYKSMGGARPMWNPEGRAPIQALAEGAGIVGKQLPNVPSAVANATLRAVRGGDISADGSTMMDRAVSATNVPQEENPDPNYQSVSGIDQSLGFSVSNMLPSIGAGALGNMVSPGVGTGAGFATSAAIAYRASKDQFLDDVKKKAETEKGSKLTEKEWETLKDTSEAAAMKYGAWEAIPEALSNAIALKMISRPLVGATRAARIADAAKRLGKEQIAEQVTETATTLGQNEAEREVGLSNEKMSVADAFRQQAIQTALVSGIQGGTMQAGRAIYDRVRGNRAASTEERPTTDPSAQPEEAATEPAQEAQPEPAAKPTTKQPQEAQPSGPLGRAVQNGTQQVVNDVAAQAEQNAAAAENHTPDEFMGPVGSETTVHPADDPNDSFPAVVQGYRDGNAIVVDENGEILEFGPHEVVRPDAVADVVQQQPAQEVTEPVQQQIPVEQAIEEQPRQQKAVSEMTEPELRDRLKYLHQQAKSSGGWNERLTKARREVEKAIDAKNAPVQGEIDTEAVQANGLTPSENRRLKELLNKDSRTQAESAEATRLNEKSRASLTEEVPQSTSENTVGTEGMTLVHGSGNGNLTLDDIQIVRANGQKQGKKGRVYGGFYGTSEKDSAQAEGYAGMMEGTPTVYDVKIKPGTKVFQKEGDITRLSENTINDLVSKGYGVVVGTDPRGRTEYAVIDKNAIQQLSKRGVANAETTNVSDERSAQPEVSQVAQPDNAPAVQSDESGTAAQSERVASNTDQPAAGSGADAVSGRTTVDTDHSLNKDGSQKWFGTERKANEYLQKKGIIGTHEIRLVDRRFEIHAKGQDGTLIGEGTTEKAAPSKGKNGPRYNRVKKLLGAEEGDIVTPQEDIGYTTAGRQYRIDQIEKNGIVHLTNLETNGGTTVSLGELERAKSRKSGFNRVESVAETAPAAQEGQQNIRESSNTPRVTVGKDEQSWVNQNAQQHRERADKAGVTRDIEKLFAEGKTVAQVENELTGRLSFVDKEERANFLIGVRATLGIPSRATEEGKAEFAAWKADYDARRGAEQPKATDFRENQNPSTENVRENADSSTKPVEYGANNKLVSQDRAAELRKKLKAKFSQLNSGLDPEILAIGTELAVFHIEAGVRKFADFARAMSADLDVPISRLRPYLRGWFNGARDIMEDSGISIEGMDSHETVRAELAKLDQAPVKEEAPAQTAPKAENQAPVNQPAPASQARTTSALDDMVSAFDNEVTPNVSGTRTGMEPDSRNAADAVSGNESTVLDGSGRNNRSNEQPGQRPESERSAGQRNQRVSEDGAASRRESGNQPVHQPNGQFVAEGRDAGNSERSGSRGNSQAGSPVEQQRRRAIADNAHAAGAGDLDSRLKAQKAAKGAPTAWADKASIDAALPLLLPEQRGDVLKIEQRHQVATGVLSTNGTGTGKTATGLGAAKRFYNAGKKNIAIVVPTDKVASDWVKFAGMMDIPLRQLSGIDDAGGSGPIVTTYANFGQNDALYSRQWDLIITDESHYLSSNANGDSTAALDKLRGLTGHPDGFQHWLIGNNKALHEEMTAENAILAKMNTSQNGYQAQEQKVSKLLKQWGEIREPAQKEWQQRWTEQRDLPKVVFLSATPFAYVKNTDYAEGYLFHHTPPAERYTENSTGGYNSANDRERFYMEHFGYRMRYNKLTQPEAGVNTELMEQNFNQWLKDTGALFGRRLDVPFDYDRRFQLIDDAAGKKLDDALRFLNEAENGIYRPIYDEVMRTFDYQRRMFLLESMKARAAVPVIREHLKLGRKVVVFHDYNQGGGFSPFAEALTEMKDLDMRSTASELFQRPMFRINFSGLDSAINTIKKAFPNVLLFNGTVSKGKRRQNADFFNADNSGKNLILVQSDAGREGVSLHDTTGKHQRVEINLGMPTRPVAATQIEGRIYRTGQASDAIFRYMTTGTSWEASTFASKIAERAATAENLALGEEARGLKQSFIDAYNEAEPMQASREDGKGGKERDQALSQNITPFDKAKTFYYAQQKNTKRRDQREGQDYFATPEPVGLKMVEWANIKPGDKVLEPSAGHGAIARFFPAQSDVTMVEPSYDLSQRAALANGTARIINGRFEDLSRANKFDAIVMNPPFGTGGKTAYEHLAKAAKHLRQGGRLVALVPRGGISERRFDQFFGGDEAKGLDLVARIKMPWVTFERAGTKVATEVLVFERHDKSDGSIIPVRPDLSSAQTINELFDRIEGLTLPERQPLTADEAIANAADGTMYSVPQVQQQTAREFAASLREENPGLKIDLVGSGKVVTLSRIVVPDDARNSGTGTAVMQRLTQWADQNGKTLALSPSGDFGGNKARLGDFYKRFGFVENKGRAKDYEISETMYREPQETRMSVTADPGTVTRGETGELAQQLLDSGRLELHSAPPAPEYAAVGGWIDPDGKIHLALYNLRPEDVQPTLMHELFHAGMRNIGGDRRWVNLMDRLGQYYRAAQNSGAKNEWTAAVERIQNAQRQGDRMNDAARDHVIEELGAYAVENFEKMPAGIRKWAESIIGAVKNYLQQTFGLQLGKVTPGQLRALAAGAIRNQKAPATSTSFSTPPSEKEKQKFFDDKWDSVADLPDNTLKTVMPAILRATPFRFMLKRVAKDIPSLSRYADVKLQMDTLRDEWHAKTDQEAQKWLKYRVGNSEENTELMSLMHDSTLAQNDPSKDFISILNGVDLAALREKKRGDPAFDAAAEKAQEDAKRKASYAPLKARYDALSPEGKRIYNRIRDLYSELADAQEQVIIDNMEKALDIRAKQVRRQFDDEMQRIQDEGMKGKEKDDAIEKAKKAMNSGLRKDAWNRRARINQLRSEFESNRLAGPYFPLARFGDFFVTAREKGSGEVISFSRMESAFAQSREARRLKKEGYDVEVGVISQDGDLRRQVPADFVARVEDLLKGIGGTEQMQDQIWQLYLERMPDYSLRKNRIHRKGRAGFEEDALRAFANHMFHGSHQLARMKYNMELGDLIDEAAREAKKTRSPVRSGLVVEQARRNHAYVMNPTSNRISQAATQGAFIWYMAGNVSSAIVNMAQTVTVAPSKLALLNKSDPWKGYAQANMQITKALLDLGRGKTLAAKSPRVTGEEKQAIEWAYRIGLITRTQSHDVAGIGDSGIKYTPTRARLMKIASFLFHHTERINREATFLAAYRMAKKQGMGSRDAEKAAAEATWSSHYDYQNTSRPAIMHGNLGKTLLALRSYNINMIADLAYTTYEAINPRDKKERQEAFVQMTGLGLSIAFNAGIRGLPLYGLVMTIANMFTDDGEDPETELKKFLQRYIPVWATQLMFDGVPGYGSGTDISSRIGFGDLWFRSDEMDREGADLILFWGQQILGATSSIPVNIIKGIADINDGYTWRGMEKIVPSFIKNPMKAYRYYDEGVATKDGDPIVDEVGGWDIFKQALGFTPARVSEQYKMNNGDMLMQKSISDERTKLLGDFYKAWKKQDEKKQDEIIDKMRDYSQRFPEKAIKSSDIRQSLKSRERRKDQLISGVRIDPKLIPRLEENRPEPGYR